MEDDADLDPIIVVNMHCHTSDREAALKTVETFSRMMVGLALDGIDVSINVSVLEEMDDEYEEIVEDGGEES